eukprot:5739556-Amphidinium_carterae.1
MNQIQTAQLKKHWLGENRDLYRDDIFQKQAAGNSRTSIALMCFRCLGESEGEPLKYCNKARPEKPAAIFRQMVVRIQNAHKTTVRYMDHLQKS